MTVNLVIGSEGFVGKPLCKFLEKQGEGVVAFDLKRRVEEDARVAELDFHEIDRVYFLAWEVGGAKYLYRRDTQLRQLDWNLKLLLNIMPQLEARPVPFLFVSSQLAEMYDSVYGVTKRLGELWTQLLHGVRVRLWNVYGSIETPSERSHVVADFVFQALTTGCIKMLTTGQELRQFIHIGDVCPAFHQALAEGLTGLYDVTSFEWVKVIDVANIIAECTGAVVIPGDRLGSTPITPLQGKVPGWVPRISLRDGLVRMIADVKSLGDAPPHETPEQP